MSSTPNVYLPPEWAPQRGVLITWPHDHSDWEENLPAVEDVFRELAGQISRFEDLVVTCRDEKHRRHIRNQLVIGGVDPTRFSLHIARSNDCWARDHGPISVFDQDKPWLLNFVFNGWGNKYKSDLDNQITSMLHAQGAFGDAGLRSIDFVLEGGSIDVDGEGTLLTTEHCLLSPKRNPGFSKEKIEHRLKTLLGVERILWLTAGHLAGDDTDSHIDTLARFCSPDTIVHVSCDDPDDEHYAGLLAMQRELQALQSYSGRPYHLVPLPWPRPKFAADGRRLPASYANFLIINNAVLVPTYNDPTDASALTCLLKCFPGRQIIGIPSLPLITQGGSLHCVTMQLPARI